MRFEEYRENYSMPTNLLDDLPAAGRDFLRETPYRCARHWALTRVAA